MGEQFGGDSVAFAAQVIDCVGRAGRRQPGTPYRDDRADIPTVTGLPNNGREGTRFLGYPVYDAVVNWDYSHPNEIALPTAGLFTNWRVAPDDPTRWIFTVRRNVTYHDGSTFRADDIIWNLDRIYNDKSPQYDAPSAPTVRTPVSMLDQYEKLDDDTIAITTKYPYAFFPHVLTRLMIASPTQWEKVGRSWQAFAKEPSGTGPFRITKHVPNQYVEMSRFEGYWNTSRIPRLLAQRGDYAAEGQKLISLVDADSFRVDGYFEETNVGSIRVAIRPRSS